MAIQFVLFIGLWVLKLPRGDLHNIGNYVPFISYCYTSNNHTSPQLTPQRTDDYGTKCLYSWIGHSQTTWNQLWKVVQNELTTVDRWSTDNQAQDKWWHFKPCRGWLSKSNLGHHNEKPRFFRAYIFTSGNNGIFSACMRIMTRRV